MNGNIEEIFKAEGITWKDFPILIIDDEPAYLKDIKRVLESEFTILTTTDYNEVGKLIKDNNVSIVASDQRMPGKTGIELLSELKKEFPCVMRILITSYLDYDAAIDAINKGEIYRYISKTARFEEKIVTFKQSIEVYFHREYERRKSLLDQAMLLSKPEEE